jgi:hypothetical protein
MGVGHSRQKVVQLLPAPLRIIYPGADRKSQMPAVDHPRSPALDGALPLAALLAVTLIVAPLHGAVYGLASLYLVFAAGMASGGAERPGEPALAWRVYSIAAGLLALIVPATGIEPRLAPLAAIPLALFAIGFVIHLKVKLAHGVCRVGILSACGRREHDARIGRTLEAMCMVLAVATVAGGRPGAGLFAVSGWLLAAAAVAERPEPGVSYALEDRPPVAEPARAA